MRSRSTATSGPAACAPRTPARCCSPASPSPSGRAQVARRPAAAALLLRLGHPHRRRRGEARYNPMSYHNGSIWPHDNALIALGLRPLRLQATAVERVFEGLFDAATYMDLRRLPELFCGFQRGRGRGPTLYPVACAPQAWASATPFPLMQACLGWNSIRRQRDPAAQSAPARSSSTMSCCAICSSSSRASISRCNATRPRSRWRYSSGAATFKSRWCSAELQSLLASSSFTVAQMICILHG